jgi:hypothetical protein
MYNKVWWICENFRGSMELIEKDNSFLVLNTVRLCFKDVSKPED